MIVWAGGLTTGRPPASTMEASAGLRPVFANTPESGAKGWPTGLAGWPGAEGPAVVAGADVGRSEGEDTRVGVGVGRRWWGRSSLGLEVGLVVSEGFGRTVTIG